MTEFTSAQYALGVKIGHAICDAFAQGATHDEVIATLRNHVHFAQIHRDMGLPEASFVRQSTGIANADQTEGPTK